MSRRFKSAAEVVSGTESDFKDVCAVLEGPSRWQQYLRDNVPIALKTAPHTFKFAAAGEFFRQARPHTLGITDKLTGQITLLDISGAGSGFAAMGAALHEMVHLVSHPPQQGKKLTVIYLLGEGLVEGLTHVITEDILDQQGIGPWADHKYGERVKIVRRLMEVFEPNSVAMFGKALFLGVTVALEPMSKALGPRVFEEIKNLATIENSQKAIERIGKR